jgi:hypothetical protein
MVLLAYLCFALLAGATGKTILKNDDALKKMRRRLSSKPLKDEKETQLKNRLRHCLSKLGMFSRGPQIRSYVTLTLWHTGTSRQTVQAPPIDCGREITQAAHARFFDDVGRGCDRHHRGGVSITNSRTA